MPKRYNHFLGGRSILTMTAQPSSSSVDVIDVDHDDVGFNHRIDNTSSETSTTTLTAAAAAAVASLEDILEFRKKNWGLRLSVSNVAAMAGFHPFASLPQLMLQLVYQSNLGKELLEHDSRLGSFFFFCASHSLKISFNRISYYFYSFLTS
jgi:hypothetical protein